MISPNRRIAAPLLAGGIVVAAIGGCATVSGLVDGRGSEFCRLLEQEYPAFRTDPQKVLGPDAGASEWTAWFDVTRQRTARLLAAAPAELGPALEAIRDTNEATAALYASAEYTPARLDAGALKQARADTGYERSVAAVTAYAEQTCGIDTTG